MKPLRQVAFSALALLGLSCQAATTLAQTPGQAVEERLTKIESAASSA
jgi:hypothetical protein